MRAMLITRDKVNRLVAAFRHYPMYIGSEMEGVPERSCRRYMNIGRDVNDELEEGKRKKSDLTKEEKLCLELYIKGRAANAMHINDFQEIQRNAAKGRPFITDPVTGKKFRTDWFPAEKYVHALTFARKGGAEDEAENAHNEEAIGGLLEIPVAPTGLDFNEMARQQQVMLRKFVEARRQEAGDDED